MARRHGVGGSALILVPTGLLVLMILSAIAVDSGAVFLAQRQLADAVTAAANDAAGAGLSDTAFYQGGSVDLDQTRVVGVICATLHAQGANGVHDVAIEAAVSTQTVGVRARGWVDEVFGHAIPGVPHRRLVQAQAVATSAVGARLPTIAPAIFHVVLC